MTDEHRHYQQLAVGHVLGGLTADDAADFRSHLAGCRDCRARVAELRGIATDLERAERDERARTLVQTEVPRRSDGEDAAGDDAAGRDRRIGVRQVTIAAVVVVLMAVSMAFWNLHLRTTNAVVTSVAEQHADALEVLAGGIAVEVDADHPVRGLAAVDGEQAAVALAGVEPLGEGARMVAWMEGPQGEVAVAQMWRAQLEDGLLALLVDLDDGHRLVLTVEHGDLPDAPEGSVVAEVELRPDR